MVGIGILLFYDSVIQIFKMRDSLRSWVSVGFAGWFLAGLHPTPGGYGDRCG